MRLLETTLRRAGVTMEDVAAETLASTSRAYAAWRTCKGFGTTGTDLLTAPDSQPKAGKNEVPTYVLHLTPADGSGTVNTCPWATEGCRAACLNTSGRGRFDTVQRGRLSRTLWADEEPKMFLARLVLEIQRAVRKHGEVGIRLNGTSDIRWERVVPWLFDMEGVTFYDYTKAPASRAANVPAGYALTASATERDTPVSIRTKAEAFGRVAIVIDTDARKRHEQLPATWGGLCTVDGDETDWRLEEAEGGVAVLLRAKGDALTDTTGFVKPTIQN